MAYQSFAILNSLNEFSFIAGTSYTLEFEVFEEDGVTPLNLGGATTYWLLSPYGQTDYPILTVLGVITGDNTFEIELTSEATELLSGKYIQQPLIISFSGSEYRPAQGVVLILPRIPLTI